MSGASVYFVNSVCVPPGYDANPPVSAVPGNGHQRGDHFVSESHQ